MSNSNRYIPLDEMPDGVVTSSSGPSAYSKYESNVRGSAAKRPLIIAAIVLACALVITVSLVLGLVVLAPKNFPVQRSASNEFLIATKGLRLDGVTPRVVARSYGGNVWEAMPDLDFPPITVTCDVYANCALDQQYEIKSIDVPTTLQAVGADERAARLLLQATFGPTKSEISNMASTFAGNATEWIKAQVGLPPSLLRKYFRERSSSRATSISGSLAYKVCEVGGRYRRYAFSRDDEHQTLTVVDTGAVFTLSVNSVLFTEVTSFLGNAPSGSGTSRFTICEVPYERLGGPVRLSNPTNNPGRYCKNSTNSFTEQNLPNPPITMSTKAPTLVQSVSAAQATLQPLQGFEEVSILKAFTATCQNRVINSVAFLSVANVIYRFDSRMKLLGNTLDNPGNFSALGNVQCPAVTKSFVNGPRCKRRPSCAPLTFSAATFTLDDANLRAWFTDSGRYPYYITGLRLDDPYDNGPCTGTSRWNITDGACATEKVVDAKSKTSFINAILASTDTNPIVRDIRLNGVNCTNTRASIGSRVTVTLPVGGTKCFEHVHPHLYDVRDATFWTLTHDGNAAAAAANRPNPIQRWAINGLTYLDYPSSHPMSRWNDRQSRLPKIGRYMDQIQFRQLRTELQTKAMADRVGATNARSDTAFEACGSPGEVANIPELGHRYQMESVGIDNVRFDAVDFRYPFAYGKSMAWMNHVLQAPDQLRQRMAWALSQICTMSSAGLSRENEIELWTNYYDIFVRNAFGNYRDILKEVTYNPTMSLYLSFRANRKFADSKNFPDENYAREIMQLFSIGLWKLNDDGTRVLDSTGNPVATYTNEDIMDYARIFTGFDFQQPRGNRERRDGARSSNEIDPSQIKPILRDMPPKSLLDNEGYIGDKYPLCNELPAAHWTKKGAKFVLTGGASVEGRTMDLESGGISNRGRFTPSSTSSALYNLLCAKDSTSNVCTFPTEVTLEDDIACDGDECNAGRVISVKIRDEPAGKTRYYQYIPVPCVGLALFNNGKWTRMDGDDIQCADPLKADHSPVCCKKGEPNAVASSYTNECLFANEATTWATAKARCEAQGNVMCDISYIGSANWERTCIQTGYQWLDSPCSVKVQVFPNGRVDVADLNNTRFFVTELSSGNVFRVNWAGGNFPTAAATGGCGAGCRMEATPLGDSCLCDYNVVDKMVYADIEKLPTKISDIRHALNIGSTPPDASYTQCQSTACLAVTGVKIWTKAANTLAIDSIFELPSWRAGGATVYLRNRESTVTIGTAYSFRNPPHFMPFVGQQVIHVQWQDDELWLPRAQNEVDALLTHLFEHNATGPFVAYRLIQRLVTSNPSPRYMKSVVDAFRTGTHAGVKYSGKYGDLEATLYAILLDHEARSPLAEADPTFGSSREPLLKIVHMLRSLEYKNRNSLQEILMLNLRGAIGQEPFAAPSVFGYYLTENRPAGPISDAGLASPESELSTTPKIISFLNAMTSLIDNGLTNCGAGFGWGARIGGRSCGSASSRNRTSDGTFTLAPEGTASEVIDQLDLLLTGGRMNTTTKQYLAAQYSETVASDNADLARKLALKMFMIAPEFHTTNANLIRATQRQVTGGVAGQGRPYKAIVIFFEAGGCDSFSRIVPMDDCKNGKDYHKEYLEVRQGAAIPKADLLTIDVPAASQPCNVFGVNQDLPDLKNMYDAGEATFIAGIGGLVEPVTKADYRKQSGRAVRFPPSLFAHNIMQRSMHNLHAQIASAKGVLGRAVTSLLTQPSPYKSEAYSLVGNIKMLEGTKPPAQLNKDSGFRRFVQYSDLKDHISRINSKESSSTFSENWGRVLQLSLNQTEGIGGKLDAVKLNTTFGEDSVSDQFEMVAKIISMRRELKTERDVFVVNRGGYDTHNTFNLSPMFQDTNRALKAFKEEMKLQGVWNDVVVMSVSDFGRTITSNGRGTDHAWSGNHFIVGGGLKGGKILGKYPEGLTPDDSLNIGRGRIIPQVAWEHPWNGILDWFGVAPANMDICLPNRKNFPDLFTKAEMFK